VILPDIGFRIPDSRFKELALDAGGFVHDQSGILGCLESVSPAAVGLTGIIGYLEVAAFPAGHLPGALLGI